LKQVPKEAEHADASHAQSPQRETSISLQKCSYNKVGGQYKLTFAIVATVSDLQKQEESEYAKHYKDAL